MNPVQTTSLSEALVARINGQTPARVTLDEEIARVGREFDKLGEDPALPTLGMANYYNMTGGIVKPRFGERSGDFQINLDPKGSDDTKMVVDHRIVFGRYGEGSTDEIPVAVRPTFHTRNLGTGYTEHADAGAALQELKTRGCLTSIADLDRLQIQYRAGIEKFAVESERKLRGQE
jgi:hypothetical protein